MGLVCVCTKYCIIFYRDWKYVSVQDWVSETTVVGVEEVILRAAIINAINRHNIIFKHKYQLFMQFYCQYLKGEFHSPLLPWFPSSFTFLSSLSLHSLLALFNCFIPPSSTKRAFSKSSSMGCQNKDEWDRIR